MHVRKILIVLILASIAFWFACHAGCAAAAPKPLPEVEYAKEK